MYAIGDKLVHPMHGAGVVQDIVEQKVNGTKREYYVLKMSLSNMLLMVPVQSSCEIGVRPIAGSAEIDGIVSELRAMEVDVVQNWNQRYRENMLRIKSGDLMQVAAVVKSLILRDKERGLSTGERKMLSSAKQILISEMVLVKDVTFEEAEEMLYHEIVV